MVIDGKKKYQETFKRKVLTDRVMVTSLFFYLFSFIITACAVMVISSRNPVHSVLFLILSRNSSRPLNRIKKANGLKRQKNIKPSTKGLTIMLNKSPKRIHSLLRDKSASLLISVISRNIDDIPKNVNVQAIFEA